MEDQFNINHNSYHPRPLNQPNTPSSQAPTRPTVEYGQRRYQVSGTSEDIPRELDHLTVNNMDQRILENSITDSDFCNFLYQQYLQSNKLEIYDKRKFKRLLVYAAGIIDTFDINRFGSVLEHVFKVCLNDSDTLLFVSKASDLILDKIEYLQNKNIGYIAKSISKFKFADTAECVVGLAKEATEFRLRGQNPMNATELSNIADALSKVRGYLPKPQQIEAAACLFKIIERIQPTPILLISLARATASYDYHGIYDEGQTTSARHFIKQFVSEMARPGTISELHFFHLGEITRILLTYLDKIKFEDAIDVMNQVVCKSLSKDEICESSVLSTLIFNVSKFYIHFNKENKQEARDFIYQLVRRTSSISSQLELTQINFLLSGLREYYDAVASLKDSSDTDEQLDDQIADCVVKLFQEAADKLSRGKLTARGKLEWASVPYLLSCLPSTIFRGSDNAKIRTATIAFAKAASNRNYLDDFKNIIQLGRLSSGLVSNYQALDISQKNAVATAILEILTETSTRASTLVLASNEQPYTQYVISAVSVCYEQYSPLQRTTIATKMTTLVQAILEKNCLKKYASENLIHLLPALGTLYDIFTRDQRKEISKVLVSAISRAREFELEDETPIAWGQLGQGIAKFAHLFNQVDRPGGDFQAKLVACMTAALEEGQFISMPALALLSNSISVYTSVYTESQTSEIVTLLTLAAQHFCSPKSWWTEFEYDQKRFEDLAMGFLSFYEKFTEDQKTVVNSLLKRLIEEADSQLDGSSSVSLLQGMPQYAHLLSPLLRTETSAETPSPVESTQSSETEQSSLNTSETDSNDLEMDVGRETIVDSMSIELETAELIEVAEFRLSDNPQLLGRLLRLMQLHKESIKGEFVRQGGRMVIDVSRINALWTVLYQLAQDDGPFCASVFPYLGIYNSRNNCSTQLDSPFNPPPVLLESGINANDLDDAFEPFFKLWICGVKDERQNTPSPHTLEGVALLKQEEGIYLPLGYTRKNCVLGLRAFADVDKNTLASLGIPLEGGLVKIQNSPLFVLHRPGVIVLEKSSTHRKLRRDDTLLGKRKGIPGSRANSSIRIVGESTNPFPEPKTQKIQKGDISEQRPSQLTTRKTASIEQISQRWHMQQTFTAVLELQKTRVAENRKTFDRGQVSLLKTLFPALSEEDISDLLHAVHSKRPITIDPKRLNDPKMVALMVLWIQSKDKCLLGLPTSDFHSFTRLLIEKLDDLKYGPLAIIMGVKQKDPDITFRVLQAIIEDKSLSLKLRLEFCSLVDNGEWRTQLLDRLARLTSTQTCLRKEFGWSEVQINVFRHQVSAKRGGECLQQLETSNDLTLAIGYRRENRLPVMGLDLAVKSARSLEEAQDSDERFIITTAKILAGLLEQKTDDDLSTLRVLTPLKKNESSAKLKTCKHLVLLDGRTSNDSQVELLEFLGFGRATLRMRQLVDKLLEIDGFSRDKYVELLGWSLLVKNVLNSARLKFSKIQETTSHSNVDIRLKISAEESFVSAQKKIQEKMLKLLKPNRLANQKIAEISGTHPDLLYVVSSNTLLLDSYLDKVRKILQQSGFDVRTISGGTRQSKRTFTDNTGDNTRITLITDRVLPSILPKWPVVLDPTMRKFSLLGASLPSLTRFSQQSVQQDSSLVEACFGEGDLTMLQCEVKAYLVRRLEKYEFSEEDQNQIESSSLSDEELKVLEGFFEQPLNDTVATGAIASPVSITAPVTQDTNVIVVHGKTFRHVSVPRGGSCLFDCFVRGNVCPELATIADWRNFLSESLLSGLETYAELLSPEDIKSIKNSLKSIPSQLPLLQRVRDLAKSDDQESKEELLKIYAKQLKETTMWGGHLEIQVAINSFDKRVVVVNKINGERIPISLDPEGASEGEIYLDYDGIHYDFLEPMT
jgi:hypothetical protein